MGPLAGRTVAIKDNTAVAGVPMTNGSATVEGYVPTTDATIVSRLLAAGRDDHRQGRLRGPLLRRRRDHRVDRPSRTLGPHTQRRWLLERQRRPVAGGVVDMATGGDQGGSIRIPAANCGLVGHKPTWGLVPYTGAFPIESTVDHVGPITRTVGDAALMLSVVAGATATTPGSPRP